jgi:glycosyltransferase involved in cell wall biosynthesis
MKLAVVIPCYNERENIPLLVERIGSTLAKRENVEVIFVDNGSTDGSDLVFADLLAGQTAIRCVKVEQNKGYGHGILFGLSKIHDADIYAWTHADMQCDPHDVLVAFDLLCNQCSGSSIVKGKRRNRALIETMFTYFMQIMVNLALNIKVDDVNAQPKVFSKRFYDTYIYGLAPHDFSLDLFLIYQAYKAKVSILEVPVIFADRIHGEAKGGGSWPARIKLIKRTVAYIFKLRRALKHTLYK